MSRLPGISAARARLVERPATVATGIEAQRWRVDVLRDVGDVDDIGGVDDPGGVL